MCPLRFILVFFSAALAGYLAWRTISSSDEAPNNITKSDQEHDSNSNPNTNTQQKQDFQFLKMVQNGIWVFVDMASGRYLWRNVKHINSGELGEKLN